MTVSKDAIFALIAEACLIKKRGASLNITLARLCIREGLKLAAHKLETERIQNEQYGHAKAAVTLDIEAIRAITIEGEQ